MNNSIIINDNKGGSTEATRQEKSGAGKALIQSAIDVSAVNPSARENTKGCEADGTQTDTAHATDLGAVDGVRGGYLAKVKTWLGASGAS